MEYFNVTLLSPRAVRRRRWLFFTQHFGFYVVCHVSAEGPGDAAMQAMRRFKRDPQFLEMDPALSLEVTKVEPVGESPFPEGRWRSGLALFAAE